VTTLTEHPGHPGTVIGEVRRGRRPRPLGGQTGTRAEERVRPREDRPSSALPQALRADGPPRWDHETRSGAGRPGRAEV